MKTVMFADVDHGKWNTALFQMDESAFDLINDGNQEVSFADFLDTMPLPDILGVENPHLAPKGSQSRAQVYYAEELERFYARAAANGCTVVGFPARLTRPALKETGHSKTEDQIGMGKFWFSNRQRIIDGKLQGIGFNVLTSPYPSQSKREQLEAAQSILKDTDERLNATRADEINKYNKNPLADIIQYSIARLYENASEDVKVGLREIFDITKKKNGEIGRIKKWSYFFSAWYAVRDEHNVIRLNPDGDFVGVSFLLQHIFGFNPYRVGGVTSGQYHHDLMQKSLEKDESVTKVAIAEFRRLLMKVDVNQAYGYAHEHGIEVRSKCISCAKELEHDVNEKPIKCKGHIPHLSKEEYRPVRSQLRKTVKAIVRAFRDFDMQDYEEHKQRLAEAATLKAREDEAKAARKLERERRKLEKSLQVAAG